MSDINPAEVAAQVCECRKGAFNPYADPHCAEHHRPWPCSALLSATEAIRAALEQAWDEGYDTGYNDRPNRDTTKPMPVNPYAKGGKS